jgi:hypothetical protein
MTLFRPIKGIVTELNVSTEEAEGITDELARKIIEHLEHEGHLPFRPTDPDGMGLSIALGGGWFRWTGWTTRACWAARPCAF